LHFAAFKGDNDVTKLLLAWKADVNAEESKYGQTAMQLAATEGHRDVAELLRWHHAKLSASLPVENQKPLTASSPNSDRVEDIRKEMKGGAGARLFSLCLP
jgi:ankyrin repeat protein